jgi:hypothetical protein
MENKETIRPVVKDENGNLYYDRKFKENTVNDKRLSSRAPAEGTQKQNDPYEKRVEVPLETEITHLRHPATGNIFLANKETLNQKHLRPCTEEGKLVPDTRVFTGMR